MKKNFLLVLAAICLMNCGGSQIDPNKPLTIGSLGPLSGPEANYGELANNILKMHLKKVNAAGGIQGQQIALDARDGGCDVIKALNEAESLIEADIKIIIGGVCSAETLSIATTTEAQRILLLSTFSTHPNIKSAGDYIYRTVPSDDTQGAILADYASARNYQNGVIISEEKTYAEGITSVFSEAAEKHNLNLTRINFQFQTIAELQEKFAEIQSNPEIDFVLIVVQNFESFAKIIQQLNALNFNKPLLVNDVVVDEQQTEIANQHAVLTRTKAVGANFAAPQGKAWEAFEQHYQDTYHEPLPYPSYAATTVIGIQMIIEVLKQAENPNKPKEIKKLLDQLEFNSNFYQAPLSFDENGEIKGISYLMYAYDPKQQKFIPTQSTK